MGASCLDSCTPPIQRRRNLIRKLLQASAIGIAALIMGSSSAFASTTATANEHPIGGSGIQGQITFTDDGSSLTVDGTSSGLTPGVPYFSLIYGDGIGPGGVSESKTVPPSAHAIAACSDVNRDGVSTVTVTQMVVGFWVNHNDGTGTLHAVKTTANGNSQDGLFKSIPGPPPFPSVYAFLQAVFGYETPAQGGLKSYAPIGETWNTISIRDASRNFALVACGEVH